MKFLPVFLALLCSAASAAPRTKPVTRSPAGKEKKEERKESKDKTKEAEKKKPKPAETQKPDKPAESEEPDKAAEAKTASLKPADLSGFEKLPSPTQEILRYALSLTERGLSYKPGSADPDTGGTDCSGFVYHVLQSRGHTNVPRQANEMYAWTWQAGTFRACNGVTTDTFEFKELRPGDLLFWVNSTRDGKTDRNPPVTHVMFYLGTRASDGRPLAAGASDGRTYDGQRMSGVSVFDFRLPSAESRARFIGYAHLPSASAATPKIEPSPPPAAKPAPKRGKATRKPTT
ncbi:MAG TPA: NlpC/P60 family protein [Verrucomicrobiales bacterium]|nr:NlpC/P60 family protein [Verrucomicrobiales bacterium]